MARNTCEMRPCGIEIAFFSKKLQKLIQRLEASLPDPHSLRQQRSQGAGGYSYIPPPIGLSTKMQNKEITTFLALLRLFFVLEWNKRFKVSFKHIFRGGLICQK